MRFPVILPVVRITLHAHGVGSALLTVAGDGVDLPAEFQLRQPPSMGLKLAAALATQLGGELASHGGKGASFEIEISLDC